MKYFIHAHGALDSVIDRDGLEFSSEDQAVAEIATSLSEIVGEMKARGEPVPFDRVDIVNADGNVIRTLSVTDFVSNDGEKWPR
ncbi:hypothetical protein CYG48_12810 [Neorhizobium sp. SOG26]|uniref:DUF6894 family protein n=1 Tax=Neorhizobium sp. SOG26 TaxID=2060726 RepID=UPI000E586E5F|nr:hypothetical protein [Neorhizobium sp. SOG26]AXV16490.1 hypothetical protein CYG48_12810 [Neorhizobium sp. SOG26]